MGGKELTFFRTKKKIIVQNGTENEMRMSINTLISFNGIVRYVWNDWKQNYYYSNFEIGLRGHAGISNKKRTGQKKIVKIEMNEPKC